jgi:hypothetical protein
MLSKAWACVGTRLAGNSWNLNGAVVGVRSEGVWDGSQMVRELFVGVIGFKCGVA